MSESGCVGFLERDQSAGELEQGEVVLGLLRPADQERAVAVEPGVAGLDDPAAGAPARSRLLQLEFVGPAAPSRSTRHTRASPNRSRSWRRNRAGPAARSRETPRPVPTPE